MRNRFFDLTSCSMLRRSRRITAPTIALLVLCSCSSPRATPPPPELYVRAIAPGMTSVQAELEVANPLEQSVMTTPGLVQLRSRTSDAQTELRLTFAAGTQPDALLGAVRERLTQVQAQLPPSVIPVIERSHDLTIYRYTVDSDQLPSSELYALHDRKIRRQLEMLSGVAAITSCGGAPQRVEIIEDPQRLASLAIVPGEISQAVRSAMLTVPGSLGLRSTLRMSDLQNLPIGQRAGAPLRLGDVASIRMGMQPPSCLAGRDRQPRVIFGQVLAQQGADVKAVQAAIDARLQQLAAELPASVRLQPFAFTSSKPMSRRESLLKQLRSGGALDVKPRLLQVRLQPANAPIAADGPLGTALRKLAGELPLVESVVTQVHLTDDFARPSVSEIELLLALPIPAQDHLPGVALQPIVDALRAGLEKLPGGPFEVELRATDALGAWPSARPPVPIGLRVCGPELSQLAQLSQKLRASLSSVPAARLLRVDGATQRAAQRVTLDRNALALHGITASEVAKTLATLIGGETLGRIADGEDQLDVVARAEGTELAAMFELIKLKSQSGSWVPLRALASITLESEPAVILREERQRCVLLRLTAMTADPQDLIRQAEARVRGVQLPAGVETKWISPLSP